MRRLLLAVMLLLLVGTASATINITEYGVDAYTASSTNDGFVASNVGDLNNNTIWASDATPAGVTITADFGAGVNRVVNNYTIKINPAYGAQVPYRWLLTGSNDGVVYTTIHDHSTSAYGYHLTSPNVSYTSGTTTQAAYRYYQLLITESEAGAGYTTIGELILANETFTAAPSTGAIPDFIAIPNVSAQYGMKVQFTNTTTIPASTTFNWTFGDGNSSTWYEDDFETNTILDYNQVFNRYAVSGGKLRNVGNGTDLVSTKSNRTDVDVYAKLACINTGATGRESALVISGDGTMPSSEPNGYAVRINWATQQISLVRSLGGARTTLIAGTVKTFSNNTEYAVRIHKEGDNLSIFYENEQIGATVTDSMISVGGNVGMYNYQAGGSATFTFNDLMIHVPNSTAYGDTSTLANPTYTYDVAGRYSVIMNATNSTGYNRIYKKLLINLTSDTDDYLKSRIHFLGSPGSVYVKGEEGLAWSSGSFSISNTQFKFNQTSGAFLNPNSFISTPSTPILDFGTGDFTIEQWVYPFTTGADYVLVSRSSSNTLSDGWGIYHGAGAASDDWHFYMGDRATNASTAFTLPLNTWSHVAVVRKDGIINVYVNGQAATTPVSQPGPYDVTTPLVYGDPNVGVRSFDGYLDETSYSNIARWDGAFTPPYAEYRGDLFPTYPDPNPDSILRFKTDPANPSVATISNLTARNRTVQIQNVEIANNLSATITYDPNHLFPKRVLPNATVFDGINFTRVEIHPDEGTVMINLTRPGGFHIVGGTRTSVADIEFVYWNYTDPCCGNEFFGDGFLKNSTSGIDYPIDTFIQTNVTYLDWKTFSNFTMNSTTPVINTPVQMFTELNYTANAFTIDWGDGISETITHRNPNHTYTSIGTKDISLTAFVSQNVSITNTTLRLGAVNVTLADDTLMADFTATQTSVPPSSLITFTSTSIIANTTNVIYNWTFGDGGYAQNETVVNHVYVYSGVYSVTLLVYNVNELGESTDFETKTDYIVVAQSSQSQTWYSPHQVRFEVVNEYGNKLTGISVNATVNETSLPSGWLASAYGINSVVANDMLNGTLRMVATTGTDGAVVFTMHGSIAYDVRATNPATGKEFIVQVMPLDSNYLLRMESGNLPVAEDSVYNQLRNTSLTFTEPNHSYVTLGVQYRDAAAKTTSLKFFVMAAHNRTVVYSEDLGDPGSALVFANWTTPNIRGLTYIWNYTAVRT